MSNNAKDRMKDRIRSSSRAHDLLIEPVETVNETKPQNASPRRREKFTDRHTPQTFYIENELLEAFHLAAGNEKGEKTRIINDALRNYLHDIKI